MFRLLQKDAFRLSAIEKMTPFCRKIFITMIPYYVISLIEQKVKTSLSKICIPFRKMTIIILVKMS